MSEYKESGERGRNHSIYTAAMDADRSCASRLQPSRATHWLLPVFLLAILFAPETLQAHVGSKDVFERVSAGPYRLMVTVRTPTVVPGIARIEVRSSGAKVNSIHITAVPLTGEDIKNRPATDAMLQLPNDTSSFAGSLWVAAAGPWKLQFDISGAAGEQNTTIPVQAANLSTMTVHRSLGITLGLLGLLLLIGLAGIGVAALNDIKLQPQSDVATRLKTRAICAAAGGIAIAGLLIWGGIEWWAVDAANRPLQMQTVLNGNQLQLTIIAPGRENQKPQFLLKNDFLLDHGHLMHLYAIHWPQMDAVFHLHPAPAPADAGHFQLALPSMPEGEYRLYADLVHKNGSPETLQTAIKVPAKMRGAPLGIDDAEGRPEPLDRGMLGNSYTLPDGYVMVWDRPAAVTADTAYVFSFRLLNAQLKPAVDMQPYLGMAGHAAFVKTDGTAFAHTHPDGTAPMAAAMLAHANMPGHESDGMAMDMPMDSAAISSKVEFPYGFPSAGRYRIFIQMKHGDTVETGAFDVMVH